MTFALIYYIISSVTRFSRKMKFFENQLYDRSQRLFSKLQCGFRKGHSTQLCLLVLIEKYCKVLDERGFAGLLLTNLFKGC